MAKFIEVEDREEAGAYALENNIPYEILEKVEGGFFAFATLDEYKTWCNQY